MTGTRFAAYLLVMAGVTYAVRALPFVLLRRRIENAFVVSLLHYAPYAVLGAMTFPDIFLSTGSAPGAAAGFAAAFAAAWLRLPMVAVAVIGSAFAIAGELLWG